MVKHNLPISIDVKITVISHISFQEQLESLQKVRQLIFKFMLHIIAQQAINKMATLTLMYLAKTAVDSGWPGSSAAQTRDIQQARAEGLHPTSPASGKASIQAHQTGGSGCYPPQGKRQKCLGPDLGRMRQLGLSHKEDGNW